MARCSSQVAGEPPSGPRQRLHTGRGGTRHPPCVLFNSQARTTYGRLPEGENLIRALVFDFDGLILDTETPLRLSWNEIYHEVGLSVPPEEWAAFLGSAADPPAAYEALERHLGRPVDRESLRLRRQAREDEFLAQETLLPGVRLLLDEAARMQLGLSVASSSDRAWVEGHLARFGLLDVFDAVVCAEDVKSAKPSPDLYLEALRRLGVRATEAIAFEDSAHGVRAAKAAGVFCIAVPNKTTCHLAFAGADLTLASLAERPLLDLLRAAESHQNASGGGACER